MSMIVLKNQKGDQTFTFITHAACIVTINIDAEENIYTNKLSVDDGLELYGILTEEFNWYELKGESNEERHRNDLSESDDHSNCSNTDFVC